MLVSRAHAEVVRSAVFCTVCNLFVFDIICDQIVLPYSSVVLVTAVYVLISVSLEFPQCVVMSAFSIFVVFFALSVVFCMCYESAWGRMLNLLFLWFCPWNVLCCLYS